MNADTLTIEILEDGTIKTTSDAVSAANHDNAEGFLKAMARLAGGETVRTPRTDVHYHREHAHPHSHSTEETEHLKR